MNMQSLSRAGKVWCMQVVSFTFSQLRAMWSRWSKRVSVSAKHTNNRYLNTPQKKRKLEQLQVRTSNAEKEVKKLQERIDQCAECNGVQIQPSLNDDFIHNYYEGKCSSHRRELPRRKFQAPFLGTAVPSSQDQGCQTDAAASLYD